MLLYSKMVSKSAKSMGQGWTTFARLAKCPFALSVLCLVGINIKSISF